MNFSVGIAYTFTEVIRIVNNVLDFRYFVYVVTFLFRLWTVKTGSVTSLNS